MNYLLNKDTFFWYVPDILKGAWAGYQEDEMTGGFTWGTENTWVPGAALKYYHRPEVADQPTEADAFLGPARENLTNVLARVDAHPEITFTFYLAPYSILFWDMTSRKGELEATLTMHQEILTTLTTRPNVRVFYFMDDWALITNLDCYSDHIHYSPAVCQELARRLLEEEPLSPQEVADRIDGFRTGLEHYDFDSLFQAAAE